MSKGKAFPLFTACLILTANWQSVVVNERFQRPCRHLPVLGWYLIFLIVQFQRSGAARKPQIPPVCGKAREYSHPS